MNTVREGKVDVGKCSLSGPAPPSMLRGSNAEGGLIESSPHELDRLAARFRTEGSLFVTRHSEATASSSYSNRAHWIIAPWARYLDATNGQKMEVSV